MENKAVSFSDIYSSLLSMKEQTENVADIVNGAWTGDDAVLFASAVNTKLISYINGLAGKLAALG